MSRSKAKAPREELARLSRIVIKIGSSSLAAGNDATARLAAKARGTLISRLITTIPPTQPKPNTRI